jgi:hypothetical protein
VDQVSYFTTEVTEVTEADRKEEGVGACLLRTLSILPASVFSVLSVVKSYPAKHWIALREILVRYRLSFLRPVDRSGLTS